MTCTLIGMVFTFCLTVFAIGFVVWLGARRLAEHYKGNPEAARSFVENVVMPLLVGPEEKVVRADGNSPAPVEQEPASNEPLTIAAGKKPAVVESRPSSDREQRRRP